MDVKVFLKKLDEIDAIIVELMNFCEDWRLLSDEKPPKNLR